MAAIFYRKVPQTVLVFGSETWTILAVMEMKVKGTHTGFMSQITGKRARKKAEGRWVTLR